MVRWPVPEERLLVRDARPRGPASGSGLARVLRMGWPGFHDRLGGVTMDRMGPVAALAVRDPLTSQRRRAAAIAAVLAAAGGVACALSVAAPALQGQPVHPLIALVHAGVAGSYIGAGVIALQRRPGNATGPLMAAVGFLWLVQDLYWIYQPLPYTVAATYEKLYQPALATAALAFPTGRLPGRFERRLMIVVWTWSLSNNLVRMLFFDPSQNGCPGCRQLLLVDPDQRVFRTVEQTTTYLSGLLILAVATVIVRHWRRATRAARHVMAPVLWMVGPTVVYLLADQLIDLTALTPGVRHIIVDYLPAGLAVLPAGFLIGLLRSRLAYARVGALLPELTMGVAPGRVRAALAATLRDPDLELLYWSPAGQTYVDLDGQPQKPVAGPGRALSPIDGERGPLAAVIVDKVALDEPGLMRAAIAMARLALENEQLQAEVRNQLLELRESTGRIVDAGQQARRHLERDLHDGAQQRLLALSLTLGRARARAHTAADAELSAFLEGAAADLQCAIDELRNLARGIYPVLLTQEGLSSALRALADRAPLPVEVSVVGGRFPETVEATAYFLVSEALTNAARHAVASGASVDVSVADTVLTVQVSDDGLGGLDECLLTDGSGLVGMRDRVIAVGGSLSIASPTGGGTTILARLPCA